MKATPFIAILTIASSHIAFAQKPASAVDLAKEMNSLTAAKWERGRELAFKLASLPGHKGYDIARANWKKGASPAVRSQILIVFANEDHPDTIKALHLGVRDPSPEVQETSFRLLKSIAFSDFSEGYKTYTVWFSHYGNGNLQKVRAENFERLIGEISKSKGPLRVQRLQRLTQANIGHVLRLVPAHLGPFIDITMKSKAGLLLLKELVQNGPHYPGSLVEAQAVAKLIDVLQPDKEFLREALAPGVNSDSDSMRFVCRIALARAGF